MEEKTTLQKIREQLERRMKRAIVVAIENGAKCEKQFGGITIDGVYLPSGIEYYGLVLRIPTQEIEELLEPTKDNLKKRVEELRAELKEIENQLNLNKYETHNN